MVIIIAKNNCTTFKMISFGVILLKRNVIIIAENIVAIMKASTPNRILSKIIFIGCFFVQNVG